MNISATQKSLSLIRGLLPALLVAAGLSLGGSQVRAAANPGVLPVVSKPHGKSYGEWAAAYWQWALSIPADRNPLTDTTGAFGGEGQSGEGLAGGRSNPRPGEQSRQPSEPGDVGQATRGGERASLINETLAGVRLELPLGQHSQAVSFVRIEPAERLRIIHDLGLRITGDTLALGIPKDDSPCIVECLEQARR